MTRYLILMKYMFWRCGSCLTGSHPGLAVLAEGSVLKSSGGWSSVWCEVARCLHMQVAYEQDFCSLCSVHLKFYIAGCDSLISYSLFMAKCICRSPRVYTQEI